MLTADKWTCYKRARPTFQVLRGDAEVALADFHRNATALAEPDCCLLQRQGDLTAPGDMTLELILKDD